MARPGRLTRLARSVLDRAGRHLPAGRVAVAVSGGADSGVCAWAAVEFGLPARAVFVDHGFPESAAMRRAAQAVADHLGIHLVILEVSSEGGPSLEDRARRARYSALESALDEGEQLLVGHTADDHVETVLANLLRGAGPEGLSGIPQTRGRIARPLLQVWRSETRELAGLIGLPWREDPTNLEDRFRRNVIRRELLPELEERFNPSLRSVLARTAGLLAMDEHFLDQKAGVSIEEHDGGVRLPAPLLASLALPLATRVVRRALRMARGPHAGSAEEVAAVLAVARGGDAGTVISGALPVIRERSWLVIGAGEPDEPQPVPLNLPGTTRFGTFLLEAWLESSAPDWWPLSRWTEVFDPDAITHARVRPAAEGGSIAIVGGEKPLAEALAEGGVPERLRAVWPVVEDSRRVLWIPGVRRAPTGWVGSDTSSYLWLSASRS